MGRMLWIEPLWLFGIGFNILNIILIILIIYIIVTLAKVLRKLDKALDIWLRRNKDD
ncbi:MAG: hypothetical protein FWE20_06065 [Defluviitaleaceae bacterium]|nr:hypothetical protein [Defluviitaleaceae bacterium]